MEMKHAKSTIGPRTDQPDLRDGQNYAMCLLKFLNCWRVLPGCYATLSLSEKQAFLALSFVDWQLCRSTAVSPQLTLSNTY